MNHLGTVDHRKDKITDNRTGLSNKEKSFLKTVTFE